MGVQNPGCECVDSSARRAVTAVSTAELSWKQAYGVPAQWAGTEEDIECR